MNFGLSFFQKTGVILCLLAIITISLIQCGSARRRYSEGIDSEINAPNSRLFNGINAETSIQEALMLATATQKVVANAMVNYTGLESTNTYKSLVNVNNSLTTDIIPALSSTTNF